MLCKYSLKTGREGFYDITARVRRAVAESGAENGLCVVYCPHTTAAITINEGYDGDVAHDLLLGTERAFPDRTEFRHSEGNSPAHLKAGVTGASATLIINGRELLLGAWQTIFFCEFDGPRERTFWVKILCQAPVLPAAPNMAPPL